LTPFRSNRMYVFRPADTMSKITIYHRFTRFETTRRWPRLVLFLLFPVFFVLVALFPAGRGLTAPIVWTDPPASGYERKLIVLEKRADLSGLKDKGAVVAVRARHRTVVERLKRTAAEAQAPIIEILSALQAKGEVRAYQSFFVANIIAVEATEGAWQTLESLPGIEAIEPDYSVDQIPNINETVTPNPDEIFTTEFGLRSIRAPDVWAMGITGAGVLVSHLDTGVNGAHPALSGRWRGNAGYPSADCWLDLYGTATTPTDAVGHGTQTMGIICGEVAGDTIGVAWGAQFITARVNLGNGVTTSTTVLQGFNWLIDPDGDPATFDDVPRVISNSWGLDNSTYAPCYDIFNDAIDNCEAAGIAVFFAGGNEGANGSGTMRIPADRATTEVNSFAVGGYDNIGDSIWASSSLGPSACSTDPILSIKPELVAPCRAVRSSSLGTAYATATGTSFAVAHAAGVAALMLEANPQLLPDSLKRIMLLTALDKGPQGNDNTYGYGYLDALTAVLGAFGGVGWISGHVTDVFGWDVVAPIAFLEHPHHVHTDSTGRFVIPMPAQTPLSLEVLVPTYNPYVQAVVLSAGDTLTLDIQLNLSPTSGALTGSVINCQGSPAAGASVQVGPVGNIAPALTDADGRFHIVLPAGTYDVTANDGWCAPGVSPAVQIVGRGITDIEVVLADNPQRQCSAADPYGYRACDDTDPDGPAFLWEEIDPSLGGQGVIHNLGEDGSVAVALPFTVKFYGVNRDRLWINTNGNLTFGRGFVEYINTSLPHMIAPSIYPFWDDLSDPFGGDICSFFDPVRAAFIVEWYNQPRWDGPGLQTFEAVIYDPAVYPTTTGDAVIEFHYGNLDVADQSTVGIEAASDARYIQYAFNGVYPSHASPLQYGRAIRFFAGDLTGGAPRLAVANPNLDVQVPVGQTVDTALTLQNLGTVPAAYAVSVGGAALSPYSWTSSRTTAGLAYEFVDVSATGQNLAISRDDTTSEPRHLPWFFPFYGHYFDRVSVCSNGYVSFTSGMYDWSWNNTALDDGHDPYFMLAPYWTDLDPSRGGGVYVFTDSTHDRFIIQYNQIRRFGQLGLNSFEIMLYHDGTIDFSYATLSTPLNNGTVGIKGGTINEHLQLAYDQAFLQSTTLLRIARPDTSAARCSLRSGVQGIVPPLGSARVGLRLKNDHLSLGDNPWQIQIATSDSQTTPLSAGVAVRNMPDPGLLHVVIQPADQGVRLCWNNLGAPHYCVYSGPSDGNPLGHFEASVVDTSILLPYAADVVRLFDVRICDTPTTPAPPLVMPNRKPLEPAR
jgi:subtilisin family serine protease